MNDINFKEDREKIKEDIKKLVVRLKNIKDDSRNDILEQITVLSSAISKFRKKNNKDENGLLDWCSKCGSIINHPIKNISYAFAAYAIFSFLFKRNK